MNPFKEGTTSYNDFEVLKDLKWHCSKCQLKSGQAKTWQVWRQNGITLDTDEKGNYYKKIFCAICNNKTIHRKLKSLIISAETNTRTGISSKLATRIKQLYNYEEAIFLRKFPYRELEIDHKFPQVRWSRNENINKDDMSDIEIKNKFILLTRANNLLKSRYCEKCKNTGNRGIFPGIKFWYLGGENWEGDPSDEAGCKGCFWYDPYEWRKNLNKKVD